MVCEFSNPKFLTLRKVSYAEAGAVTVAQDLTLVVCASLSETKAPSLAPKGRAAGPRRWHCRSGTF